MELNDRRRPDFESQRFRLAMGELEQAVLLIDPEQLCILDANETAAVLWESSLADLKNTNLNTLGFSPIGEWDKTFQAVVEKRHCLEQVSTFVTRQGVSFTAKLQWRVAQILIKLSSLLFY